MSFLRVRSFQGRIFLAILVVVLLPAAVAVAGGALTLRSIGTRSGTLGAWDAVAESGQALLDAVERSGAADPAVREAAARHREALSGSVRMSRLYTFVAQRVIRALPLVALVAGIAVAVLAFLTARLLSRGFGRPVAELAGWTERIARGEPLPPASEESESVRELDTLRQALRRMADQIEEGRRKAVENARMRSWTNLARRVAHEIKNPLTPMSMAAAALAKGREGAEAEAARVLQDEIRRLDELARTFAQYGRVPEGPRSQVDLGELVRMLGAQHGSERVPVQVSAPAVGVVVNAHYDALERAFRNLVLNAVEAQEVPGGLVELTVAEEGGRALVRVEDRGPGIPPELLEEIWNPDVTTKSRGTGLGLALVRQAVNHHGGEVSVANRAGGGARFEVRLPLAPTPGGDTLHSGSA
ncbi:MAG TPA: HAMP domain-containing sensor histidine kinase [Longimicrobiales bacterium]|nr:HAMP domain-containing sensor histidine kinase [Longimicrobiales bacterium]